MKTLKVLLQEVVSGIKAWVNSNFAQESNAVHKTGNETVNGVKTFTGNVFQNQAGGVNVYCATCDGAVKGDLTSSGQFSIVCKDGSNANMNTSGLAAVYMGQDTSGSYVALRADTSYNNTRYDASVSLDIDPTTANNNAIFRPRRDNTIDLGSSSYQFKNLYANNYYYKGTAWGLDKANTWSNANIFTRNVDDSFLLFKSTNINALVPTDPNYHFADINFCDVNSKIISKVRSSGTGTKIITEITARSWSADGTTNEEVKLDLVSDIQHSDKRAAINSNFMPSANNSYDLGTSTNKWKTLNGIDPGALSLPNLTSNGYINLSDNISANTEYSYTPPADGWLALYVLTTGFHVENAVGIFNGSGSGNAYRLACSATSGINLARSSYYHGAVLLPVIASIPYLCWIKIDSSTTLASKTLYFYKAAGNV